MLGLVISKPQRVFGLDVFRTLAILLVLHSHGRHLLVDTPLDFMARGALPHGVDLFFVLSGYLIGCSAMRMMDSDTLRHQCRSTWQFYLMTALRILPNYYALLVVNYLAVGGGLIDGNVSVQPAWRFITLTQNVVTPLYDFYWESWSLPMQWWFYIVFPFLLLLLRPLGSRRAVPLLVVAVAAGAMVFRWAVSPQATDYFWWDVWERKTVLAREDAIFAGVLMAWFQRICPVWWRRGRWLFLAVGVVLLALTLILPKENGTFYTNVIYLELTPIAVALMLPAFRSWQVDDWQTSLPTRIVTAISLLSYAMFLTNLVTVQVIDRHLAVGGITAYLVFIAATVIGACMLYLFVERWPMMLRRRIRSAVVVDSER